MFTMFSPEMSDKLSEAIKRGSVSDFAQALDEAGGDPSGLLYAKARKTAWPLIKRVLETPFKTSRLEIQLEMGRHLLRRGVDTYISAPWGQSLIGDLSSCLRQQARWEDRLVLLRFIAQLVDTWSLESDIRSKSEYTDLDYVFSHASWEFSHGAGELMAKATLEVAKILIEMRAPMTMHDQYANYTRQVELGHVRLTHEEALVIEEVAVDAVYHREPLSAFDRATPLDASVMTEALQGAWDDADHPRHKAIRAVGVLRDRAFRHHGWGWGPAEDASIELLNELLQSLTNKDERRAMKKHMTKLSKVHKPIFDELIYTEMAQLVTTAETST